MDLLDSDADSDRVNGALDQNFLFVVTADDHRLEEQLFTTPESEKRNNPPFFNMPVTRTAQFQPSSSTDSPYFHLGLVVSLHNLGGEILQAEGSLQGRTHRIEIWA